MQDLLREAAEILGRRHAECVVELGAAWINKFGTVPNLICTGNREFPSRAWFEEQDPPQPAPNDVAFMALAKAFDQREWWADEPENAIIRMWCEDMSVYVEIVHGAKVDGMLSLVVEP